MRSRCRRQALRVIGIDQQSRIADDFGQRPAVRHDDRHACRHRLERRYAESFIEGRQHERLRAFEQRFAIVGGNVAAVLDVAGERRLVHRASTRRRSAFRASGDHEARSVGAPREQPRVCVEQPADILARLDRADEEQVAARICARSAAPFHSGAPFGQTEMRSRRNVEQPLHFAGDEIARRR